MRKYFFRYVSFFLSVILMLESVNFAAFATTNDDETTVATFSPEVFEDSTFNLVNANVQVGDIYGDENTYISEVPISTPEWYAQANGESENIANSVARADQMVLLVQKWLNQEYGDVAGFGSVAEDGYTGWDTIYGLLRALQHELGITSLANSFGPSTSSLYSQNLLRRQDGVTDRKFAILQGALWCKGYNPGYYLYQQADGTVVFEEVFNESVEQAIIQLKKDAGFINPDGIVTLNVMKALMSMDSFKLLGSYGGDSTVRTMQQKLNRKYEAYIGLIPCDGVYGRDTNQALIYALQAEEGLPTSVANGNFGVTTQLCCPTIPYAKNSTAARRYPGTSSGSYYTNSQISAVTELLQFALYVNGASNIDIDGIWGSQTQQAIKDFQQRLAISVTGKADKATWMSLFLSSGDTSRSALACDCATILTQAKAQTLYNNGYRYVGRYLTGTYNGGISKAITKEEAEIIFDSGLRFFPIFQSSANYASYFTPAQGASDAEKAIAAASALGLPKDTTIYFAVDFDALDYQVTSLIIPYFKEVHEVMSNSIYRTGIYGTRNTCSRVSALGYAYSSFVGDMSTGFSGNLGYAMPDNWAFDQFKTISLGSGAGYIEIDKDGFSGRDHGVSYLDETITTNTSMDGDINFGSTDSATLEGPTINILGQEVSLFEFKMAFDNFDLDSKLKYDPEKGIYKIAYGLQSKADSTLKTKEYAELKEMIRCLGGKTTTATWNNYQKMRAKLKRVNLDFGFKFDGYLGGYAEINAHTGEVIESSIIITAETSTSLKWPVSVIFLKLELVGKFETKLSLVLTEIGQIDANGHIKFTPIIKGGIEAGTKGFNAFGGVSGSLECQLNLPMKSFAEAFSAEFTASVFLEVNILSFSDTFQKELYKTKLFPKDEQPQLLDISPSDVNLALITPQPSSPSTSRSTNTTTIRENMQIYCQPQIESLGNGNMIMLYIDDSAERSAENRTILMYSIYNGSEWSSPLPVMDDNTGDFAPQVVSDGNGGAHIIWQNMSSVLGDDIDVNDMAETIEIYYTHWNGTGFENTTAITHNNATYEYMHKIVESEGNLAIIWIENTENVNSSANNTSSIYRRQFVNDTWQNTELIASGYSVISDVSSGYINGVNVVAFSAGTDTSTSGTENLEIYYYDGVLLNQVTNDDIADSSVCILNDALIWTGGNAITRVPCNNLSAKTTLLDSSNNKISSLRTIETASSSAILWTQSDNCTLSFYGMTIDSNGEFSNIKPLHVDSGYINGWDACMLPSGQIEFLYCLVAEEGNSESGKPYGRIDLIQNTANDFVDISVNSIVTYEGEILPGETLDVTATVTNNGSLPVSELNVRVLDENSSVVTTTAVETAIPAGECAEVTVSVPLPQTISKTTYEVEVLPVGNNDISMEDNTAVFTFGYGDISIENIDEIRVENGRKLNVTVKNCGFETIDTASLRFLKGGYSGSLISQNDFTEISPSETVVFSFTVAEDEINSTASGKPSIYYISAETSYEDSNYSNNSREIYIYPDYSVNLASGVGGSVFGTGVYAKDDLVTVCATPNAGYIFDGWYENGNLLHSISEEYTFTVDENRDLEAKFKPNDLNLSNIEVFGTLEVESTITFTATTTGGVHPVQWTYSIYTNENDETVNIATSTSSLDFFEWTSSVNGTYYITVTATDSTGYTVSRTTQFTIA